MELGLEYMDMNVHKAISVFSRSEISECDKSILCQMFCLNSSKDIGVIKRKLKSKYEEAYKLISYIDNLGLEEITKVKENFESPSKDDILAFCNRIDLRYNLGHGDAIATTKKTLEEIKNILFSSLDSFAENNSAFLDIDENSIIEEKLIDGYSLYTFNFVLYGLHLNTLNEIEKILNNCKDNIEKIFEQSFGQFTQLLSSTDKYKTAVKFDKSLNKDKSDNRTLIKSMCGLVKANLI